MTTATEAKPWDFSHVLDLVNSLSTHPESPPDHQTSHSYPDNHFHTNNILDICSTTAEGDGTVKEEGGLGDFSKLWTYLGAPHSLQPSFSHSLAVQPPDAQQLNFPFVSISDYVSDDAAYFANRAPAPSRASRREKKAASLQQQTSTDGQGTETVSDGSAVPEDLALTTKEKKKLARRAKRENQAVREAEEAKKKQERALQKRQRKADKKAQKNAAAISESEADVLTQQAGTEKWATPQPVTPNNHYNLRARDASGKVISVQQPGSTNLATAWPQSEQTYSEPEPTPSKSTAHALRPGFVPTERGHTPVQFKNGNVSADDTHAIRSTQQQLFKTPMRADTTRLIPSTVQPTNKVRARHSKANQNSAPPKENNVIQPILVRSSEDRYWALLLKLLGDFYEDRSHLISPMNLTTHNNDPKGIHVFVDASNIFIGFKEQLKRVRGIHHFAHVQDVNLSFDSLALLMERRRSVAKRVLVGSTPHMPAFDKAKAVGYECSILEKVYKQRELTERQIFFKERDSHGYAKRAKAPPANNVVMIGGNVNGSSGSETNTPQYAPAAMIEQGVDELLHLKMMESLVDTEVPGTMVLATGDAAQAEYSEGFMAMVYRALKKGWTVELVSWSANISAMYKKQQWVAMWGDRFRIVYLDDYAEELLDM